MQVDLLAPSPGESVTSVELSQWLKPDGSFVKKGDAVATFESEKATLDIYADISGILKVSAKQGEAMAPKTIVGSITEADAPHEEEAKNEEPSAPQKDSSPTAQAPIASPAAAKILAESGVQPQNVTGTGKDGRITKEDAVSASKASAPPASIAEAPKAAPAPQAQTATPGASQPPLAENRQKSAAQMSMFRRRLAERLVEVKNTTAMLTTFNEVDMSNIMDVRSKYKEQFKKKHDVGVGFMSFFVAACSTALQEFPLVNGCIEGESIVTHNYIDMGIAVSTPKGLVVPVIRDAQRMSLAGIESEIIRLAGKARDGKLSIEEMSGGTFTITNGGIFGSMLSTPLINPPQSAILGMHNIVQRPVAIDGQVVIRPMMYVALSYDHRIVDGRESVGLLVRVKEMLEDPVRLLLKV